MILRTTIPLAQKAMTITKKELIDNLVDRMGLSARGSKALVVAFFDTIRETLASGEGVKLSGFGNIEVLDKRPRPGRNPRTNEPCEITARRVVSFHPGMKFKKRCLGERDKI